MPYCSNCGTFISEAILTQNDGLSNRCHLSFSGSLTSLSPNVTTTAVSMSINKCAVCEQIAGMHCKECGKLLCEKHTKIYHAEHLSRIVCPTCQLKLQQDDGEKRFCCGCSFFVIIIIMITFAVL